LNILQRIFKALTPRQNYGYITSASNASYFGSRYQEFARYAYQQNLVVFRCINIIASAFSSSPLRVYDLSSDIEIPNHPVRMLFKRPNTFQTEFRFWENYWIDWWLSGNVFIYKVRDGSRKIIGLQILRPDMVEIKVGSNGYVEYYKYRLSGQTDIIIEPPDIMHDLAYNPTNEYIGQSPLLAGLREIATDNERTDFVKATLQNRGISPGVLLFMESNAQISEDARKREAEYWKQQFSKENRGKMGMFSGVRDAKVLSLNLSELEMPELTASMQADVCAIFGVPANLVGVKVGLDKLTYENFATSRRVLWEDNIEVLQNRVDDGMSFGLAEMLQGVYLRFDNSEISALSIVKNDKIDSTVRGLQAGLYTRNEARERLGLPLVDGGDVFLQSIAIIERGSDNTGLQEETPMGIEKAVLKTTSKPVGSRGVGLVQSSLGRGRQAIRWYDKMLDTAKAEFAWQLKEIERVIRPHYSPIKKADKIPPYIHDLGDDIYDALDRAFVASAAGKFSPLLMANILEAARLAAKEVDYDLNLNQDTLIDFINHYQFKFAERISSTSVNDVRGIIREGYENGIDFDDLMDKLKEKFIPRPEMVARSEVVRAANYGAKEAWRQAGIGRTQWLAGSDSCPYCLAVDGHTINIGESYFELDDGFRPDETVPVMNFNYERVEAPPLHPNCTCTEVPVI